MDKQYWILINNELLGPYTALEIIDLNLLDSTPITDNLDNERWKTVGSIDFNVSEADEKSQKERIIVMILTRCGWMEVAISSITNKIIQSMAQELPDKC